MPTSKILTTILQAIPGRRTFGIYRFMPIFFLIGATVEWSMISWQPNGVNFCEDMPAGVTWRTYVTGLAISLLSMFAGAQTVHSIYKPLDHFQEEVEKRKAEIRAERAEQNSAEEKTSV